MGGLYLLLPTLLVIVLSFFVVRAAATALRLTGMEEQRARFQALSAFTGTGFTTREAEIVVNNPLRRRVVTWLMILGNAGIVTVIVSATSSVVVTTQRYHLLIGIAVLILVIYGFWKLASRGGLTRWWESFIEKRLLKSGAFRHDVIEELFLVKENLAIMRVVAAGDTSLIGSSLGKRILRRRDLLVLGIERGRKWFALPKPDVIIEEGDRIVVYGHPSALRRNLAKS
jgi:hypothetical protein